MNAPISKQTAIKFIVLLGCVSLLADINYEGARSIIGQYLSLLGANGAIIGFVAGLGELMGYSFRLLFGYIGDKTGRYWLLTFSGYTLTLFSVPLLAFTNQWPVAAFLIILERLGKAIRTPSRDAMLSYATKEIGRGLGFGIHRALDQTGAVVGPLLISGILYFQWSYTTCFAMLFIPAILALAVLTRARILYPTPQDMEKVTPSLKSEGFAKSYWLYMIAVFCIAAGYLDFPLIAYHLKKNQIVSDIWLPLFFAFAMAASAVSRQIKERRPMASLI